MIVDEVEVARSLIGKRQAVEEVKAEIAELEELYLGKLRNDLTLLQADEELLKVELLEKMKTSGVKSFDCDGRTVVKATKTTRKIVDEALLSAEVLANMKAIAKFTGETAKNLKGKLFTMSLDKNNLKDLNVVDTLIDVEGVKLESVKDIPTEYVTIK